MSKLVALVLQLVAACRARVQDAHVDAAVDTVLRRSTQLVAAAKPALRRAETWRADVALVVRGELAQRFDRRISGVPLMAWHAVAERPVVMPAAVRDHTRRAVVAVDAVVDHVAGRFAPRFPDPAQARLAASVFTTSLALVCAGVVGAVAFVDPAPLMRLPHHPSAERASSLPVAAAAAPADGAAAAPGPAGTPAAAGGGAPAAVPAPVPSVLLGEGKGGLPIGKGMWIWLHERAEGGDANAIVARAKTWGFTHLYVRTATLKEGFMAGPFLDRLLPVAHANGLRVYGWDFPYMWDPGADVNRALAAIRHTTPDGHRIDGFAPDIETRHEGTNENIEAVRAYVNWLRQNVGEQYPLIAVIPNPTPGRIARGYPFADIIGPFDAVAPMVYWMNRDPASDVGHAIAYLNQFGKPVFPIGQAYDGAIDGGPAGIPDRTSLIRFMQTADQIGAVSVSFWSWHHASPDAWNAISDAMEFRLGHGPPESLRPPMILAYQAQLAYFGYAVPRDGTWSPATELAVRAFQRDMKLPETGTIDILTREQLLRPRVATVRPAGH